MREIIEKSIAHGSVRVPPSKSDAHRKLICAAMCAGKTTVIRGMYASQDILATVDCIKAMGAECRIADGAFYVKGTDFSLSAGAVLNCRESGSTLRFFIPLCMLSGGLFRLCGTKKLISRPLSVYEKLAGQNGIRFEKSDESINVCGRLGARSLAVQGNISSQFITGLMLWAAASGGAEIKIEESFESRPYALMTAAVLREFGVTAEVGEDVVTVSGSLESPGGTTVEGDWSSAAFFEALNHMGGDVDVVGAPGDSFQPDKAFADIAKTSPLCADLSDCPDLAPMLFALAAYMGGGEFSGTARLRYKESDRALAMKLELEKFGADVQVGENSVSVVCESLHAPDDVLYAHNDHRIAMALSVLCTAVGGTVDGAEAVAKSMPDFYEKLRSLGVRCHEADS